MAMDMVTMAMATMDTTMARDLLLLSHTMVTMVITMDMVIMVMVMDTTVTITMVRGKHLLSQAITMATMDMVMGTMDTTAITDTFTAKDQRSLSLGMATTATMDMDMAIMDTTVIIMDRILDRILDS